MQELNKTLKRIDIRVTLKGRGGVNYDSDEQKYFLYKYCGRNIFITKPNGEKKVKENGKYLKKAFYKNEKQNENDPDCYYRLKISAECLRNNIFGGCSDEQSPIWKNNDVATHFITSPLGYMRGYMVPEGGTNGIGKAHTLWVVSAIDDDAVIAEEMCSKSGDRDSNSIRYKEDVGDTKYVFEAGFDIEEAQFLSLDNNFGRVAVIPSYYEGENLFEKKMVKRYGRVPYKVGVFTNKTDVMGEYGGEYGYLFDDDYINFLIKTALKRLLTINITRATGYARTCKVEIVPVYDVFKPIREDDWTEISADDVDAMNFNIHHFYEEASVDEWKKRTEEIEAKRAAETEKKKEKKAKKNSKKETEENTEE